MLKKELPKVQAHKPLVLIVDDALKNLQIIANMLSKENYEIAMAESGQIALSMLEEIAPDLILLDIMMPGMNGYEVCEKIKENSKLNDIPIIFLTAKTETDDIVKGFELGAADYISKPFKIPELLSRIKVHIELREKTRQLLEFNQQLEEMVKIRTSQLQVANKRLSLLDKAKTDFLWLISHELHSPLNSIFAFTELLKTVVITDEQKEYCNLINTSSKQIERFLKISHIITELRAEKYELQRQKIKIRDLLSFSIDIVRSKAQLKKIEILRELKNDSTELYVDISLIQKCLENILDNAIRFSPVHSEIHVKGYITNGNYVVDIADNGKGFSNEMMDYLNGTVTSDDLNRNKDGNGMGLIMSKFIMEANLGKIHAQNIPNGGALVRLLFELE